MNMKTILFASLLVCNSFLSVAQTSSSSMDSAGYANKVVGTVVLIGDTWLIEAIEDGSLQRYVPIDQDKTWHTEGMEIVFTGVIGRPDPTVRSMGNPLILREWRKLYRASPDNSGQ